jgi:hypothetical protein
VHEAVAQVEVTRIDEGLWRWTTAHPGWTPDEGGPEGWEAEVGCVYAELERAIVLVDPLVPRDEAEQARFWAALDRDVERLGVDVAVLLTVRWHGRSAAAVQERYPQASVWAGRATAAAVEGVAVDRVFAPGDALPGGVVPFVIACAAEVVYWLPPYRALVPGDVLLGGEDGLRLCPAGWLDDGVGLDDLRRELVPLLALPVERVLVSHGAPVLEGAAGALARALGRDG